MRDPNRRSIMVARCALLIGLFAMPVCASDGDKPLAPVEARKQTGKEITVKMEVKAAKDRLEKRGEIYLDAEENFKDEKNFAVVITRKGAAGLKDAGITDLADHFKGKTITAKGTVKEVDGVPRIEIDDAKQIAVAKD
jgi:DNA/RNA endonuclease YhcR with UshA esterase domain